MTPKNCLKNQGHYPRFDCEDCPRLHDDCDGDNDYQERIEKEDDE